MIENVPEITIGGSSYPVYSVDFSNGGSESPSYLDVIYINRDGDYATPILNTQTKVKIQMGGFQFSGYPVASQIESAVNGNTLSVKYVDDSIILDKVFVGLKGLHGPGFTTIQSGSFTNMILLGRQVDPCDDLPSNYNDPCLPRVENSVNEPINSNLSQEGLERLIDCEEEKSLKILDLQYTFDDLLTAMTSYVKIQSGTRPTGNVNYFNRHTGTLRSVLLAWCQEFGYTFFWENGFLNFVDLKKGIEINDTLNGVGCKILSKKVRESIESSYTDANIYYFGVEGEIKDYNVESSSSASRFAVKPITLVDIFTKSNGAVVPFIKKSYTSIGVLESCCALSRYSTKLRDIIVLRDLYNLRTVADYKGAIGRDLKLLGLKITDVYAYTDTENSSNALLAQFNEEIKNRPEIQNAIEERKEDTLWIKCEYNEDVHRKYLELEQNLANDFLGKYWIRFFKFGDRYNFNAPDGSVEYFPRGTEVIFPFLKFIPDNAKAASGFIREYISTGEQESPQGGAVPVDESHGSFVLMTRDSLWEPEAGGSEILEKIEKYCSLYHFTGFWGELFDNKNSAVDVEEGEGLFFCTLPNDITVNYSVSASHPTENKNQDISYASNSISTSYGLRSDRCGRYSIRAGNNKMSIFTPPQVYIASGNDLPGYTIIADYNGSITYTNRFTIPKKEVVLGDVPGHHKNSMSIRVNFRDLSQVLLKYITGTGSSCQFSESEILSALNAFKYRTNAPDNTGVSLIEIEYSLSGMPVDELKIRDGMSSFSINLGQDGITSSVVFRNIPKTPFSEEYYINEFLKNITKRTANERIASATHKTR